MDEGIYRKGGRTITYIYMGFFLGALAEFK